MDIKQFTHLLGDGPIEIEQILPMVFKKRPDIVFVEFKERTLAIGTLQGIPVFFSPFPMITDANFSDISLAQGCPRRNLNGNRECL